MLPVSWNFNTLYNGSRSFNDRNMESAGETAAKLLAIKLWEWFDLGTTQIRADWFDQGQGRVADFFMRPPTLTASNFAAPWSTDLKFLAFKDLNPFSRCAKFQEATSILRLSFALSKWLHFDSVHLLGGPFVLLLIVHFHCYESWNHKDQKWHFIHQKFEKFENLSNCRNIYLKRKLRTNRIKI